MRIITKNPKEPLIRKGSFQEEQKGDLDFYNSQVLATEPAGNHDGDFNTHL